MTLPFLSGIICEIVQLQLSFIILQQNLYYKTIPAQAEDMAAELRAPPAVIQRPPVEEVLVHAIRNEKPPSGNVFSGIGGAAFPSSNACPTLCRRVYG